MALPAVCLIVVSRLPGASVGQRPASDSTRSSMGEDDMAASFLAQSFYAANLLTCKTCNI
jgi:hypothetical protein